MKCGIEIHQRLATEKKLFCGCSAQPSEDKPIATVERMQRAVAGELGDVDLAALHEYSRGRKYRYQIFPQTTCLVELDEEPPHSMNGEALEIAVEVCLLLNSKVVDEVEVMRKTVIDGSNTSGFQRTSIIGLGGFIETSKGRVGIEAICLEEESSGIVGEKAGEITYRLDRLGIPLVEIATSPDIKDAKHAREVAEKLGMILRATGKVQRGIGTIRQDINISVPEGARVEVKGAQELGLIETIVDKEVRRQEKLVKIKGELEKRFGKKRFEKPAVVEVTEIFKNSASKLLRKECLLAMKLTNFAGLLGEELYENRRLGTELSDYAVAKAGVGGIIHSDEKLEKYPISGEEVGRLREKIGAGAHDAFVLVAGDRKTCMRALEAVCERVLQAFEGPQNEVRKVLPDGGTSYMRPMPGSARLYPETDVPPIEISRKWVEGIKLPEMPEERKARLLKILNEELAEKIMLSENYPLFEKVVGELKVEAKFVATTLEETLVSLRREGVPVEKLNENKLMELFIEYKCGKFVKAAIPEILRRVSKNTGESISSAVEKLKLEKMGEAELRKIVEEKKKAGVSSKTLIQEIMREHRLRVDAEELSKVI
ncbi:MAG: Glu-tRNA(Gln) amidotransferase subunit GatE [Candidatus Micrarchaeota archaeon]|nr:Glu-tRNA(Gln) amidotransferase subunit GatE [Candidatus Micrarchaeota archaeon]